MRGLVANIVWQTKESTNKHSGGSEPRAMGTGGTLKRIISADNDRNLKRAWSGLELARFARVLSAVEKIMTYESVDTRRGRSVLEKLKEVELPSYRRETFLFVRRPTKATTSNFVSVAHFARFRGIIIVLQNHTDIARLREQGEIRREKVYTLKHIILRGRLRGKCTWNFEIKTMPTSRRSPPREAWACFGLRSLVIGLFRSSTIFWRGFVGDTCGRQIGKHVSADLCVRETFVRFKRYPVCHV